MSGPIIIAIFGLAIFLLVKYRVQVKNSFASMSTAIPTSTSNGNNKVIRIAIIVFGATVALLLIVWLLPSQAPSLKTVVEVTQSYWLWLLLVGCIAYVLLSFIPKGKGDLVKKSKTILTAFGLLLVGALVWSWVARGGDGRRQSEKMTLVIPANGDSAHVSPPAGYSPAFTGYGFMSHCVYRDGTDLEYPCAPTGPIVYYYVHDNTGRANLVTYEFVRP